MYLLHKKQIKTKIYLSLSCKTSL